MDKLKETVTWFEANPMAIFALVMVIGTLWLVRVLWKNM